MFPFAKKRKISMVSHQIHAKNLLLAFLLDCWWKAFLSQNHAGLKTDIYLAWENSQYFTIVPLISPQNDICGISTKIQSWWLITTKIWVVFPIG